MGDNSFRSPLQSIIIIITMDRGVFTSSGVVNVSRLASRLRRSARRESNFSIYRRGGHFFVTEIQRYTPSLYIYHHHHQRHHHHHHHHPHLIPGHVKVWSDKVRYMQHTGTRPIFHTFCQKKMNEK